MNRLGYMLLRYKEVSRMEEGPALSQGLLENSFGCERLGVVGWGGCFPAGARVALFAVADVVVGWCWEHHRVGTRPRGPCIRAFQMQVAAAGHDGTWSSERLHFWVCTLRFIYQPSFSSNPNFEITGYAIDYY